MRLLQGFAISLLLIGSAIAADETQSEINQLTQFDSQYFPLQGVVSPDSQMPVSEYLALWRDILPPELIVFKLQNALYKLKFYPYVPTGDVNPEYLQAIRDFQTSIGAKPTGVLLVGQWVELVRRVNTLFPGNFHAGLIYPEPMGFLLTEGYLSATGSWMPDQSQGHPYLQTTDVKCYQEANVCITATAMILRDDNNPISPDDFTVGITVWQIDTWDEEEIVAANDLDPCVKATLFVNIKGKEVHKMYRFYPGEFCQNTANRQPLMLQLVDGHRFAKAYYQAQMHEGDSYYSPSYLEKIQRLKNLSIPSPGSTATQKEKGDG